MILGPLFRREYRAALRQRRSFRLRVISALGLVLIAGATGYLVMYQFPVVGLSNAEQVTRAGRAMFLATLLTESALLMFFVPATVGVAIAEERQQDTLDILLLTRLRPIELATVKALARWLPVLQLLLSGLPIILATALLAGLYREAALTVVVLVSTSLFLAVLAILGSGQKPPTPGSNATPSPLAGGLALTGAATAKNSAVGAGQAMAFLLAMGWLMFPPVMAAAPVRTGELWGDLLFEVKRVCIPIAPSSPVSLVTDRGWLTAPATALDLESRVALMVGLQAAFALPILLLAAGRLRAGEDRANWADPTRGYRPPVGDDPIYWREFELPSRRGSGSLGVIARRLVVILVQTLLVTVVTILGVYLLVVIPLSILLAFLSFGYAAVGEAWKEGYFFREGASYTARESFNVVIRVATGLLGLLPAMLLGTMAGSRLTAERDKKAWDIFLTTPLDARTILRSKVRAALESLNLAIRLLLVAWALGLLLGVVHPLGLLLAAVQLAAMVAAGLAVSLNLALRPGPPRATTNQSAAWNLVLFGLSGVALALMLVSPLERHEMGSWPFWLRLSLIAVAVVAPLGTVLIAWLFGRQLLNRFEEWAGRPLPPDPAANPFGASGSVALATPPPTLTAVPSGPAAARAGGA